MDQNCHLWYVCVTLYAYSLHGIVDTQGYPGVAAKVWVCKAWHVNDKTSFHAKCDGARHSLIIELALQTGSADACMSGIFGIIDESLPGRSIEPLWRFQYVQIHTGNL